MSKQTELAQVADTITVDSGNVGIGTSSPSEVLELTAGATNFGLLVNNATGNPSRITLTNSEGSGYIDQNNNLMRFNQSGSVDISIDSSGNLLVSATTTSGFQSSSSESGTIAYAAGGIASNSPSNDVAGVFNRLGTDGIIVQLKKDGSTVGSIGNLSDDSIYIAGNSQAVANLAFGGTSVIYPTVDNVGDVGATTRRFDDIYVLSVISTSDRNEKQDIAELSDAEQRVAVACKGLMRKFRWKNRVAEKGDDARIHFGIIAQDLQAAFAAEGLDAGDYAMFISTTWWEHDVEVPAVEAVAEVTETTTDEDGNEVVTVVTEAVEAADAYTRTDTYDTQEEAPEGATERTRLGVRYSELLAFIIGAL